MWKRRLESVLHERAAEAGAVSSGSACGATCSSSGRSGRGVARVVVVQAGRLDKLERYRRQAGEEARRDTWADNEDNEQNEHGEVEDRVADDATAAQFGLLEGVDGRSYLTTGKMLVCLQRSRC